MEENFANGALKSGIVEPQQKQSLPIKGVGEMPLRKSGLPQGTTLETGRSDAEISEACCKAPVLALKGTQ